MTHLSQIEWLIYSWVRNFIAYIIDIMNFLVNSIIGNIFICLNLANNISIVFVILIVDNFQTIFDFFFFFFFFFFFDFFFFFIFVCRK